MRKGFSTISIIGIIAGLILLIITILIDNSPATRIIPISFLVILGYLLIISSGYYFIHGKSGVPFTFLLIFVVVIIMVLLVIFRDSIFGMRINEMSYDVAKFYFEQILNILTGLFAAFVIGISVLWVAFKPVYLKKGRTIEQVGGTTIGILTRHTIFLFLLFGYVILALYLGIIIDLSKQISGI